MEIKGYQKIIKGNKKLIMSITGLIVFFTMLFTFISPVYYEASFSFLVSRFGADSTADYKYDGYYALKASDLMADTVEQWLKNPEAVQSIYAKAGVDGRFKSLKDMARKFKATKLTSQLVEVRLKAEKSEDAKKVAEAASGILKNKIAAINNAEEKNGTFKIIDSAPVILEAKPDPVLNLAIGLIFGAVLGLFIALGKEYFEE